LTEALCEREEDEKYYDCGRRREAPSNSEMISSLPAMSGCSKAVVGLEMLI
jgi:hypothetical protein